MRKTKERLDMARGIKLQDHIEVELKGPEFAAAYLASALDALVKKSVYRT